MPRPAPPLHADESASSCLAHSPIPQRIPAFVPLSTTPRMRAPLLSLLRTDCRQALSVLCNRDVLLSPFDADRVAAPASPLKPTMSLVFAIDARVCFANSQTVGEVLRCRREPPPSVPFPSVCAPRLRLTQTDATSRIRLFHAGSPEVHPKPSPHSPTPPT